MVQPIHINYQKKNHPSIKIKNMKEKLSQILDWCNEFCEIKLIILLPYK